MMTPRQRQDVITSAMDAAVLALRGERLHEALGFVREVLRLDPSHSGARLLEARVQLLRDRPSATLSVLDQRDLQQLNDTASPRRSDLRAKWLRARALLRSGQPALAAGLLETMTRGREAEPVVWSALASAWLAADNRARAEAALRRWRQADPHDRVAARTLCDLLADDDPSAALRALEPVRGDDRARAAKLCVRLGRLAEAETHLAALLRRHADDAALLLEAGALAEQTGEIARAEQRFHRTATSATAPVNERRHGWLGVARCAARRAAWSTAVWACRRGAGVTRHDDVQPATRLEALAGLVVLAEHAGRHELAQRADRRLRRWADRATRRRLVARWWPLGMIGVLAERLGEETADATASRAAVPPMPAVLTELLEESVGTLATVAERHAQRADVHHHLSMMLAPLGRREQADTHNAEALRINPQYQAAQRFVKQAA